MENKINYLLTYPFSDLDNEELESHLYNHICILQSGYLEKGIQELITNYKHSNHFNVHECKQDIRSMRKIQNAKWCSIRPTLLNIDTNIVTRLETLDRFDNITDSINNIVITRHKIAHGEDVTNLTIDKLEDSFEHIKLFLNKLQEIFEIYN